MNDTDLIDPCRDLIDHVAVRIVVDTDLIDHLGDLIVDDGDLIDQVPV